MRGSGVRILFAAPPTVWSSQCEGTGKTTFAREYLPHVAQVMQRSALAFDC
jgi:hypothetical protein